MGLIQDAEGFLGGAAQTVESAASSAVNAVSNSFNSGVQLGQNVVNQAVQQVAQAPAAISQFGGNVSTGIRQAIENVPSPVSQPSYSAPSLSSPSVSTQFNAPPVSAPSFSLPNLNIGAGASGLLLNPVTEPLGLALGAATYLTDVFNPATAVSLSESSQATPSGSSFSTGGYPADMGSSQAIMGTSGYGIQAGPVRSVDEALKLNQVQSAAEIAEQSRADYTANAPIGSEQWAENLIGLSSEYHYLAGTTGIPEPANPFAYTGDLALAYLKGTNPSSKSSAYGESPTDTSILQLPGGLGIQDVAFNNALAGHGGDQADALTGYQTAISAIEKSEGQYGPYATLYGGPAYTGTPSSEGLRVTPGYVYPGNRLETTTLPAVTPVTPSTTTAAIGGSASTGFNLVGYLEGGVSAVDSAFSHFLGVNTQAATPTGGVNPFTTAVSSPSPVTAPVISTTPSVSKSTLVPSDFDLFASNLNIPVLSGALVATSDFLLGGRTTIQNVTTTTELPAPYVSNAPSGYTPSDIGYTSESTKTTELPSIGGAALSNAADVLGIPKFSESDLASLDTKAASGDAVAKLEDFGANVYQDLRTDPVANFAVPLLGAAAGGAIAGAGIEAVGLGIEAAAGSSLPVVGTVGRILASPVASAIGTGLLYGTGALAVGVGVGNIIEQPTTAAQAKSSVQFGSELVGFYAGMDLYPDIADISEKAISDIGSIPSRISALGEAGTGTGLYPGYNEEAVLGRGPIRTFDLTSFENAGIELNPEAAGESQNIGGGYVPSASDLGIVQSKSITLFGNEITVPRFSGDISPLSSREFGTDITINPFEYASVRGIAPPSFSEEQTTAEFLRGGGLGVDITGQPRLSEAPAPITQPKYITIGEESYIRIDNPVTGESHYELNVSPIPPDVLPGVGDLGSFTDLAKTTNPVLPEITGFDLTLAPDIDLTPKGLETRISGAPVSQQMYDLIVNPSITAGTRNTGVTSFDALIKQAEVSARVSPALDLATQLDILPSATEGTFAAAQIDLSNFEDALTGVLESEKRSVTDFVPTELTEYTPPEKTTAGSVMSYLEITPEDVTVTTYNESASDQIPASISIPSSITSPSLVTSPIQVAANIPTVESVSASISRSNQTTGDIIASITGVNTDSLFRSGSILDTDTSDINEDKIPLGYVPFIPGVPESPTITISGPNTPIPPYTPPPSPPTYPSPTTPLPIPPIPPIFGLPGAGPYAPLPVGRRAKGPVQIEYFGYGPSASFKKLMRI